MGQIDRQDPDRVAWELAQPSLMAAKGKVPVRIGLLAGLKTLPKSQATLQRELTLARSVGFAGIDFFSMKRRANTFRRSN